MEILAQTTPAPEFYKYLISIITPRPIAWVSTISKAGVPNLAPFSFSSGVTSHPPTHLFCPANHSDGRKKDTLINIEETGEYVCNVVPYALRVPMVASSEEFPPNVNEFEKAGITAVASTLIKPPRVKESPVAMECKVIQIIPIGTGPNAGNIVVGEILVLHIDDAVMKNGKIDPDVMDTIGRMGGADYCRTTERFTLTRCKPVA
jgi:flavin reductase (DIM6/NTAB) family NADH-FMN oxidoreductase RutF